MILFEKNRYDNGIVSENAKGADIEQSRLDGLPKTAAFQYKYPFSDQVLIHAQRPGAVACTELEACNKLVQDYLMVNSDHMDLDEVSKMDELEHQLGVMLYDRQDRRLRQNKTDRHNYILYVRDLYTNGKIDAETRESLMRLACNFEEE